MTQSERMDAARFGAIVQKARKKAGLSCAQAGEKLAVSARQIQKYENGTLFVPVDILHRMADVYGDPWLETTYCQCVCPIDACPHVQIGADIMRSLLEVNMYDPARLAEAERMLYQIMSDGVIERSERADFERSAREVETRTAQLLALTATVRAARVQAAER